MLYEPLVDVEIQRTYDENGMRIVVTPMTQGPVEPQIDLSRAMNYIGNGLQEICKRETFIRLRAAIPHSPHTMNTIPETGQIHATYVFNNALLDVPYLSASIQTLFGSHLI